MRLAELPFQTTDHAVLQEFPERMMGFEPTTFCMASGRSVRARSRPFAENRDLQVILTPDRTRANPNEPRA
jgi:hypothetical protein